MKLLSPEEFELCFIYFLKLFNYIFYTLCMSKAVYFYCTMSITHLWPFSQK